MKRCTKCGDEFNPPTTENLTHLERYYCVDCTKQINEAKGEESKVYIKYLPLDILKAMENSMQHDLRSVEAGLVALDTESKELAKDEKRNRIETTIRLIKKEDIALRLKEIRFYMSQKEKSKSDIFIPG